MKLVNTQIVFLFHLLFFLALFTSAQGLQETSPEKVGLSPERLNYLTNGMQDYIDDNKLAGSVVLVARKGKIAYYEAFGKTDIENNIAMPKDAIFRIASQSKAIVSVAIMILQEEGKLYIKEPLSKYIPEYKNTTVEVANENDGYTIEKAKREITLRDLLTHTAGIGYGYGHAAEEWKKAGIQGWYFANRNEPILTTIRQMASLPMEAQPGEEFVYGYNTDILGAVVEIVSGQTLDVFLRERIFNPLGMNDTYFYLPKEKSKRLTTVYSYNDEKLERLSDSGEINSQGMYINGPRKSFSGGAGLLSTAMDYAKFLQMMLNEGSFNGNRILSRKSVELMITNHLGEIKFPWGRGAGFGLGFSTVESLGDRGDLGSKGEYGWGGAYHSVYWVDPKEDMVLVYFTQALPANGLDDHIKFRNLVYQAIAD